MGTTLIDVGPARIEVTRIAAARAGQPSLVWLHEGLGSVSAWRDFPARVAAATGAETVVYSRRGYGRSSRRERPSGVGYLHDEAREALPALLAALGVERPLLVGHSDGASIALIHAGSGYPCAGLVVMAPHVSVEEKALAGIRSVGATWSSSGLAARLARHHDDAEHAFAGWHDAWLDPGFGAWNIEALIPAVTAPILVIQGEDDEYATAEQPRAIARAAAAPCEVRMLPGCGHSPHRDRPEETLALIARFVADVAAGRWEGSDG